MHAVGAMGQNYESSEQERERGEGRTAWLDVGICAQACATHEVIV